MFYCCLCFNYTKMNAIRNKSGFLNCCWNRSSGAGIKENCVRILYDSRGIFGDSDFLRGVRSGDLE